MCACAPACAPHLQANVSLADIRALAGLRAGEEEEALAKPALWLVTEHSRRAKEDAESKAPITVLPTDTLDTAIEILSSARRWGGVCLCVACVLPVSIKCESLTLD